LLPPTLTGSRRSSRSLIYRRACRSISTTALHQSRRARHRQPSFAAAAAAAAVPRRREGRPGRAGRRGRAVIACRTTHAAPCSRLPLPRTPIDRRDDSSPPTEHPPPQPAPAPPPPAHPAASVAAMEVRPGCRPPPRSSRHFIKTASEFHARAIKASRCGDAQSPDHCIGISAISVIFCHSLSSDQLIDAWQLRGRTIHTSTLLCWQLLLKSWAELTSGC